MLAGERTVASVNISDWLDRKLRNSDSVPLAESNKHDPRRLSEYDIFSIPIPLCTGTEIGEGTDQRPEVRES